MVNSFFYFRLKMQDKSPFFRQHSDKQQEWFVSGGLKMTPDAYEELRRCVSVHKEELNCHLN